MKLTISCLAVVLCSLSFPSAAQTQLIKTQTGGYTTYVADQPFGTETYSLTTNADGSLKSEAEVAFASTKFRAITVVARERPISYTVEMAGVVSLKEEFTSEGVKVTVPGLPDKQVTERPNALLENGVAHHFIFLMNQYDLTRGGAQTFRAFLPSQALAFTVNLERVDSPKFKLGRQEIATEHFRAGTISACPLRSGPMPPGPRCSFRSPPNVLRLCVTDLRYWPQ